MRVFVTGGSGFIGRAIIRRLGLEGHRVSALARSDGAAAAVTEAGADPVPGDLVGPGPWQSKAAAADAVVHTGAMVSDWGRREDFFRVNVGGTRNVLEALEGWGGHFIHLSTIAVHGLRPGCYTEDSPLSPGRHPYCASKAAAEELVDSAVLKGLRASVVRITGAYGPGDAHFTARLLDMIGSGRLFAIGRGDQPARMIYIDDITEALTVLLRRPGEPGARYLLNDPSLPDVIGMMRLALAALGKSAPIRKVPIGLAMAVALGQELRARWTGRPPWLTRYFVRAVGCRCVFSSEKTNRELGWAPRMPAGEGVERTVAWYRAYRRNGPGKPGPAAEGA